MAAPPAAAANTTVSKSDPEFSELSYSGGGNDSFVILQVEERSFASPQQKYKKCSVFHTYVGENDGEDEPIWQSSSLLRCPERWRCQPNLLSTESGNSFFKKVH
jgi:hypothetical protein